MSWSKHPIEWTDGHGAYLSIAFTWNLPQAYSRCVWYRKLGYDRSLQTLFVGSCREEER